MSTAFTKSQRHKKQSAVEQSSNALNSESPVLKAPGEISDRAWLIGCAAILAVAAFLRFYDLALVPFHHDEGVNGNFLVTLVRDGRYHYDPANYHGPTLYYFSALIPWIIRFLFGPAAQNTYGLTTVMIRMVPAAFGLATIWLVLSLRRRLGSIGTLAAAGLLAISPGAVYLSRYFIHETLFVFFTLGLVVAALKFYEEAHPVYLVLAAAATALLFATKETAIISAGVLVIAFATTHVYRRLTVKKRTVSTGQAITDFIERIGGPTQLAIWVLVATAVFVGLNVLFYSSFFTNYPKGVTDALKTFEFWSKTGKEAHVHPAYQYVLWLKSREPVLLGLGVVGAVIVVLKPRNSFALFSALWAFGLIAAYSLISYKTPWLALNFIVPLALIAGYVFQFAATWAGQRELIVAGALAFAIGAYQTIDLNFINYDNDDQSYVYVYAHTRRETLRLLDEIDRIAKQNQGGQTGITIVSPDYWPLPWYLRDYSRVGYYGRMSDSNEPIIIASEGQIAEVQQRFGSRYQQVGGPFPLRPGVSLVLFQRR